MGNMCSDDKARTTGEVESVKPGRAEEDNTPEGRYTVLIEGARGLRRADWFPGTGTSDAFVALREEGKDLHKTKVINDSLEPLWQETAEIDHEAGKALEFTIKDKDVVGSDSLGKVVIEAKDFEITGLNKELKLTGAGGDQAYLKVRIKKASRSEYPTGPPGKIVMTVDKGDCKSYGLDLDTQSPDVLLVTKVKADGAFQAYNADKNPEQQVKKDDFIVSVGGQTTAADMLDKFRNEPSVEIEIRRPAQVVVCLDRPELAKSLGIEYGKKPTGNYLALKTIAEGVIKEHNEAVTDKDMEIRVGDFIVALGGKVMPAQTLQKTLNDTTGKFQLSIIRPWQEETSHWGFFGFGS